jgi:hypothetical protein
MKIYVDQRSDYAMTAADRCDRCSARAVVATVIRSSGTLLWCAHHYAVNQAALQAGAAVVVRDDRPSR